MILFSAGLAAAAAAAARRRRQRLGAPAPLSQPDLSRLLWGEALAATRALSARIRRRTTR